MIWCARVFRHDVAAILVPFLCYTSTGNENCGPCAVSAGLCSAVCVVLFTCHQACWPGFQPCCVPQLSSWCSVQCQWIVHHPYHTTPTTSHSHYTRQDLLDIGAASSSSAGLSLPCWSRISDTWALPAINHRNRGGVAGMNCRRSMWGSIAVTDLSIDHPLTPFLPSLTANTTLFTQTPPQLVTDAKSHFSSNSHHQKQGNLIHINPNQNNNGPTVTVFNTKSVGPKESK